MKSTLLSILLLGVLNVSFAQQSQTIRGQVIDEQSKSPLFGVNIILVDESMTNGASSDGDGRFELKNVPIGRQTLQVSYLGYEAKTIGNLVVNSGKELVITIELVEKVNSLKSVTVTAEKDKHKATNEMSMISSRSFTVEETGRYSGSLADPSRMAQNFAGVSGANDSRNDIIIRGNSPSGLLWQLEGVSIPSPNHFATLGGTGGPVSMLNINNLKNSDFLTSAFASEYGNALSGVFDLSLRSGNEKKTELMGQIGFNGFEVGLEGPIKIGNNASYLVNYRYSTLGVFSALGIDLGTGAAVPEYQDLTFKVRIPTKSNNIFTVFGLGGLSFIEFLGEESEGANLFSNDAENLRFISNTGVLGASYTHFIDKNTSAKLLLSASGTENSGKVDTIATDTRETTHVFGQRFLQSKYTANLKYNKKFSARNRLTTGLIHDLYDFQLKDSSLTVANIFTSETDFTGKLNLSQAYIQDQFKFNTKASLVVGLHAQLLLENGSFNLEPRIAYSYKVRTRGTLTIGSGLHSQMQPITAYFKISENPNGSINDSNKDLDFTKSWHNVIGYEFLINSELRLKTEIYYQYLYDVPVDNNPSPFSMLNAGADFGIPDNANLKNGGTGENYGLELTLEKFFSKGYYYLTTVSVFNSMYIGSDNIKRNTLFNGNYVLNGLVGKEFGFGKQKQHAFTLDSKLTLAGNRRFTPIDLEQSIMQNREVVDPSRTFENQYDPYFRVDLKFGIRLNGKKIAQAFSVDLQNVSNQKNIFIQGYSQKRQAIDNVYQRGFFPDVRWQIFF